MKLMDQKKASLEAEVSDLCDWKKILANPVIESS